jgi:O-antigen/teichoic acid export membrane protein
LVTPANWAANTMLIHQPNGFAQLGVFTAASQWRYAVWFLPTVMSRPFLSVLSELHATGNRKLYRRVFLGNIGAAAAVAMVPALALVALAPHIMRAYGTGFGGGAIVLQVLTVSAVFASSCTAVGTAIAGSGRMWISFGFNGAWSAIMLATTAALLGRGALGLALANLVAYMFHATYQTIFVLVSLNEKAGEPSREANTVGIVDGTSVDRGAPLVGQDDRCPETREASSSDDTQ